MKRYLVVIAILALVTVLVTGCTGTPSPTTTPTSPTLTPTPTSPTSTPAPTLPAGMGMLEVRVTDAPPEYGTIKEIWVEVSDSEEEGVAVHKAGDDGEGEWIDIPITEENNPFELLELKEKGVDALLGWATVPAGKYTQIRMTIKEVKVIFEGATEAEKDDETKVAKLPSGNLKFVRPFNVVDGETTIILLDFIADKSVTVTGKGDVIFKPVIKLVVSGKEKPIELEYSLETTDDDDATAELSTEKAYRGKESVHLETTGTEGDGDEARIVIPLPEGTTLGDIESISWWEYLVQGYPPHVDIMLDFDSDDVADDSLVFEYAYNSEDHYNLEAPMPYGAVPDDWYQTFSDDGEGPAQVDDDANGWLASGPPGPPGDSNFIYGTLAEWKDGTVDASVDNTTVVLALEIEVDNWVVQSEAYVDDIEIVIGGVTYTVGF